MLGIRHISHDDEGKGSNSKPLNNDRFYHFGKMRQEKNKKAKQLRQRGGASKVGKSANVVLKI